MCGTNRADHIPLYCDLSRYSFVRPDPSIIVQYLTLEVRELYHVVVDDSNLSYRCLAQHEHL